MIQKILTYSFYLLFFLTPLIWFPKNYELFEYNKMMFVYGLTIVIVAAWILKMAESKRLILKSTPLDIPLLLFLLANILSTIFSIDRHTSIWGYYSRSNGGLLSIISYILLYYALVSNFDGKQAIRFLKATVLGGVAVALWAIPEHFGVSPSCAILTNKLNASCWVQDVQARVFATLGQPNWLGAYLAMLIFPTLYFALTAPSKLYAIRYTLYASLLYLAFTFTYSRGATLGLIAGLIVFLGMLGWQALRLHPKGGKLNLNKPILMIIAVLFGINTFFGSALTDFKLLSRFAPPPRPSLSIPQAPVGTQLESGGTESGQIRFIVWAGAWEIFKHYPVFGSGVETFAYSYYNFRPTSHNLVSEWDFLYNKAHNEFLNYLATTGIIGFGTYMAVIITFLYWATKFSILNFQFSNRSQLLTVALAVSYISYLVQNFFGFSVVIVALFFYLFPALAFLVSDSTKPFSLPSTIYHLPSTFFRRSSWNAAFQIVVILTASLFLLNLYRFWTADTLFVEGNQADATGSPGKAFNRLTQAVTLNPGEPLYRSELGYTAASAALALNDQDATISAQLKEQAVSETAKSLAQSPQNVSLYRTAVRTYFVLSSLDPQFTQKTLETLDRLIYLAPTDPKLPYNKALILGQGDRNEEAIAELKKAVSLKPNYKEANLSLSSFYEEEGRIEEATSLMQSFLKLVPGDTDALDKINELGRK